MVVILFNVFHVRVTRDLGIHVVMFHPHLSICVNLRRGLNSLITKTQLSLRSSSGDQLGSVSADPSSPTCSALIGQSQWVLIIRWRRPGQTSNIAMWSGEIRHQIRSLRCSSFPYHLGSDKLNREKHNERIKS